MSVAGPIPPSHTPKRVQLSKLMHATVLHLPVLFGLLIYDKFTR